jgi:NO-binding membrane sensor protein with MHYT domain
MDDTPAPSTLSQAAPLLMLMAFVVLLLAAHVAAGYTRTAAREQRRPLQVVFRVAAAVALGSGLWAGIVLGMASEAQSYPLWFKGLMIGGAWVAAVLAAALALLPWLRRPHAAVAAVSGVLLAGAAIAVQMLSVRAAGLEPAVTWWPEALAMAPLLTASGCIFGLWLALVGGGQRGRQRRRWRWLAAAAMAFAKVVGQELVLVAAGVAAKTESVHAGEVPAMVAVLVAGVGVPLLLLLFEVELAMRRGVVNGIAPQARRKRVRQRQTVL